MKRIVIVFLGLLGLSIFSTSCKKGGGDTGQLIGVQDRPTWKGINPYGMIYVPQGTLNIGSDDQDLRNTYLSRAKAISIQGFYMDDTEISNNEYRQFVQWVIDSLAHTALEDFIENEDGTQSIDWEVEIDWTNESLADMYFQGNDVLDGKQEIDITKLKYQYDWFDTKSAAYDRGKTVRSSFVKKKETTVYPDTMVWTRDFAYSYNEPMTRNYFWHPAYDDYPVVGVNWVQASAFCHWRNKMWNTYRPDERHTEGFRLPTEFEWEYAARGGRNQTPFPWGGYSLRNGKGCLLANFKPGRGNYPEDGGQFTVKVDSYFPNDYGLYNMSGNVSEWTSSAYVENAYSFIHDLNPDIKYDAKEGDPESFKRKVIRGGSWKDIGYFLRNGVRHFEYQDTAKSYIGFRCVLSFMGRAPSDN
ncbi:MAG: SUMF1/EgtB/PvdO family nonheme iron enzyme [Saprospiraceae bacterium]